MLFEQGISFFSVPEKHYKRFVVVCLYVVLLSAFLLLWMILFGGRKSG